MIFFFCKQNGAVFPARQMLALTNFWKIYNTQDFNEKMEQLEHHYTLQDVAEHMQVSVRTIQRWISDGKLRAVELPSGKYGKKGVRIPLSALKEAGFGIIEVEVSEQQLDNSEIETGN
jgi:excisionase family DNA binding protein